MEDLQFFPRYTSQTDFTGPQETIGYSKIWKGVVKEAEENKDAKAQALLLLRKEISDEIIKLRIEGEKFQKNLEDYKKDLKRINNLLIGITIVVVIAFITILSLVSFDQIKEKDLYLRYSDLYQNYSERNSQLKDIINEQQIGINDLENELKILRAKNSYLK